MTIKKMLSLAMVISFVMPGYCLAQQQSKGETDNMFDEEKPKINTKKGKNVKEVEANGSAEVAAPQPAMQLSRETIQQLNDLMSQTQIAEAKLRLSTVETRLLENQQKMEEILLGPAKQGSQEVTKMSSPMSRMFPMPGGNPQVISILGGNALQMEATLKFPTGQLFDVSKGSVLENGYIVSNVNGSGVTIEKGGYRMTMPLSKGGKAAPWNAEGQEEGIPIPPPASTGTLKAQPEIPQ